MTFTSAWSSDKELGSSITQLNEGTATLNARLDASDEQTRTLAEYWKKPGQTGKSFP